MTPKEFISNAEKFKINIVDYVERQINEELNLLTISGDWKPPMIGVRVDWSRLTNDQRIELADRFKSWKRFSYLKYQAKDEKWIYLTIPDALYD